MKIREVWNHNLDQELSLLDRYLHRFPLLSIDTEFPGCLRNTPRDAPGALRYDDLKFNVDNTHMIQLGVTLSDHFVFLVWTEANSKYINDIPLPSVKGYEGFRRLRKWGRKGSCGITLFLSKPSTMPCPNTRKCISTIKTMMLLILQQMSPLTLH